MPFGEGLLDKPWTGLEAEGSGTLRMGLLEDPPLFSLPEFLAGLPRGILLGLELGLLLELPLNLLLGVGLLQIK